MGVGGNERWRDAVGDGALNCKGACRLNSDSQKILKGVTRASRRRSVTSLILAYRTISLARRFNQSLVRFADV